MRKAKRTISGRTAVISGAASGMGRSLAQRLAAHGSPVAITDIDEPGLKETAASISGPVLTRVLDVRDADAQLAWAKEVREWTPTVIGSVFNNAGVALACSVRDADPDDDQWVWDINFHGVVNGTRAFLPILVEQNEGAIVNTSSIFGLAAVGMQSAYCAAKFAVRGYTEALRQEMFGSGVTAVTVHPGGVNTNIVRNGRYRVEHGEGGPTPEEMAERLSMPLEKVRKVMKIAKEPISLETPIGDEEDSHLGDFIEDKNAVIPVDAAIQANLKETVTRVLASLTPREERVLRMRFGIGMNTDHTLEEVGQQFSVTRERIRQIEAKALRKLKHPSRSRKIRSFLDHLRSSPPGR